jgi:SAM-dependent methyltransferase
MVESRAAAGAPISELEGVHELLRGWSAGLPGAGVVLLRLLAVAGSVPEARRLLAASQEGPEGAAASSLLAILSRNERRAVTAARMLSRAQRDLDVEGEQSLARARVFFDWAVTEDPELAVAAYALDGPTALPIATSEVLDRIAAAHSLGPHCVALDFGCGTARLSAALAARCAQVVGLDVSSAMIAQARSACEHLPNVRLLEYPGRGLADFVRGTFDLIVAADVFPYLVQQGTALSHVAEFARVLRPGGDVFVFNWSYRGDDARDAREACAAFEGNGLELLVSGARLLTSWDAAVYHARGPGPGRTAPRWGTDPA